MEDGEMKKITLVLLTLLLSGCIGGGGGSVGAAHATRQRPDGYTLLLGGATTHITEGLLKTRPSYDPLKDLVPVSGIAVTAFAITVHPSVPVKDLKGLIALAKAQPANLPWGSAGHGSLNHLTGELFKLQAGITGTTHVPYRGAGPAIIDIIGGQIPMIVPAMTNHVLALHRAGRARVVAVTHGKRLAAAYDSGALLLWDLDKATLAGEAALPAPAVALVPVPDGSALLAATGRTIRRVELATLVAQP